MAQTAANQIEKSMTRLLKQLRFEFDREEEKIWLTGCDIVDNGVDKALINEDVLYLLFFLRGRTVNRVCNVLVCR